MPTLASLFVTRLYRADLAEHGKGIDMGEVEAVCLSIAEDDEAGQRWCEENGFPGYTSYSSLADLPWRMPVFKSLVKALDRHVAAFAKDLDFDLGKRKLTLDSLWINILPEGGLHTAHIHPHSVISGTTYVAMPAGTSAIRFEDPRLPMLMAAPPRRKKAREELRSFVSVAPAVGEVLLWESWLRHEVPMNMAEGGAGDSELQLWVGVKQHRPRRASGQREKEDELSDGCDRAGIHRKAPGGRRDLRTASAFSTSDAAPVR